MIISWEKQKTPSRPPLSVESNMLPESATMFSPSKILRRMRPILGRWSRSHLYATFSFHPTFLGSFQSNLTFM
jgi:hypothetical protein